jgi:outer membrane protein assembly factor BamD
VPKTAEEVYNAGLTYFKDEEYLESQKMFDVIKLQYPASSYADDAQFYLAEINYKRGEYQLAAFNYNLLRRVYPRSEFSKESLLKSGLCYYNLSPSFDREQDNTLKAIRTFSEFQALYPEDTLYKKAGEYIIEMREKLAYREYFTAVIYQKMDYYKAALIYYNSAIEEYSDCKILEDAYIGKMQVLKAMKKYEDLKTTIGLYEKAFPNSKSPSVISEIKSGL